MSLLLLLGCGGAQPDECRAWAEMEITEREASGAQIDAMWSGIWDIAEWTGRDRTCVNAVRFVEDLATPDGHGLSGQYDVSEQVIRLRGGMNTWEVERVTKHEFCHAVDRESGLLSEHAEGALDARVAAGDFDLELYPGEKAQLHEAFAEVCEMGPQQNPLFAAVVEQCEDLESDPAVAFVHEALFEPSQAVQVPTGTFTLELHETALDFERRPRIHPLGQGLLFLTWDYDEETERVSPTIELFDLGGMRVIDQAELPSFSAYWGLQEEPYWTSHMVHRSGEDLLLVARRDEDSWRVSSENGQLHLQVEQTPTLPMSYGIETGGSYLFVTQDQDNHLWRYENGEAQALHFHAPSGEPAQFGTLNTYQDGALLTWWLKDSSYVQRVDARGEALWTRQVPFADTRAISANEALNGEILVTLKTAGGRVYPGVTGLLDPESGSWSLPSGRRCSTSGNTWPLDGGRLLTLSYDYSSGATGVTLGIGHY